MNKILFLSVVILSNLHFTIAQEFSLFDAQTYALEKAEKIKRAELDFEDAKKKVVETRAIGLPQINSDFNFQNFLSIPVQAVDGSFIGQPGELVTFRAGTDYMAGAGVTVNQLLFDGSYIVGLQVSNFYKKFVEDNIEKSQQEVLYDVTRAYELALVSRENKIFLDTLVQSAQDLLDQQKNFYELGMISAEDVDQIKFALLQAKTNKSAAHYSYENAIAFLKMTMSYPMDEPIILTETLDGIMSELKSIDAYAGSIYDNIDYKLLQKQKKLNEYDLKNMRMANLPKLNATFGHQYNYFANEEFRPINAPWFYQTFVGVSLSVPIFSSGARWARVQQAKIAVKQDEFTIQEMERGLKMQEQQYKNDFLSAREQLDLQKENVKLATRIYENALVKAEIGKENSLEVTQKYQQLVTAQTQYVNAMIDVFTAKLNIDQLYNKLNRD